MNKAVVKPTSNGETLHGQSRAELRSDAQQGVETCVQPDHVTVRAQRSAETGEEPVLLNGGRESIGRDVSVLGDEKPSDSRWDSPDLRETAEPSAVRAGRAVTFGDLGHTAEVA